MAARTDDELQDDEDAFPRVGLVNNPAYPTDDEDAFPVRVPSSVQEDLIEATALLRRTVFYLRGSPAADHLRSEVEELLK